VEIRVQLIVGCREGGLEAACDRAVAILDGDGEAVARGMVAVVGASHASASSFSSINSSGA